MTGRGSAPAPCHGIAEQDEWIAAIRGIVDIEGGLMRLSTQREGLIAEVLVSPGARPDRIG